jgi:tetratricopeptide (TPR) repeat protein
MWGIKWRPLITQTISSLKRAIIKDPKNLESLCNLGLLQNQLGRLKDAAKTFSKAVNIDPNNTILLSNLAGIYQKLDRLDKAARAYQKTIDIDPTNAQFHFNLGNLMAQAQNIDRARILFERAIELDQGHFLSLKHLGNLFTTCGDFETATKILKMAMHLKPTNLEIKLEYAGAAARNKMAKESIAIYEKINTSEPPSIDILGELAFAHIANHDPKNALKIIEKGLTIFSGWTRGLAYKSIALNELELYEEAQDILNLDRFLYISEPETPHKYTNLEAFNLALIKHIKDHSSLRYNLTNRSLSKAKCTDTLLSRNQGPFADFKHLILNAYKNYLKIIAVEEGHPFVTAQPNKPNFDVWANVMDEKGFQDVHFHPTSWATGVYYPSASGVMDIVDENNNEDKYGGWLELGANYSLLPSTTKPKLRYLQPKSGLLVLFPSYVGHRTIPCHGQGERISIAFDISPEAHDFRPLTNLNSSP